MRPYSYGMRGYRSWWIRYFRLSLIYRNFTPLEFDIDTMPRPDHILITHGHYDHLDRDSLSVFAPDTHVITPLGYDAIFHPSK